MFLGTRITEWSGNPKNKTRNPKTILEWEIDSTKEVLLSNIFHHEEISWLQYATASAYLKCSYPNSALSSMAVKFVVSQEQVRCSALHALVLHCSCNIPAVSHPCRRGTEKAGTSYLFDSFLVPSILIARLILWTVILAEMTFQKSCSHRI